jgi:EF hand domain-containing protein
MLIHRRIVHLTMAAVLLAGAVAVKVRAGQSEKSTGVPPPTPEQAKRERQLAAATESARELLLTIDTNKSGKISKEEWMKFMEVEFDRLDTDHKGQLDVDELTKSRIRVRPYVGK